MIIEVTELKGRPCSSAKFSKSAEDLTKLDENLRFDADKQDNSVPKKICSHSDFEISWHLQEVVGFWE